MEYLLVKERLEKCPSTDGTDDSSAGYQARGCQDARLLELCCSNGGFRCRTCHRISGIRYEVQRNQGTWRGQSRVSTTHGLLQRIVLRGFATSFMTYLIYI